METMETENKNKMAQQPKSSKLLAKLVSFGSDSVTVHHCSTVFAEKVK